MRTPWLNRVDGGVGGGLQDCHIHYNVVYVMCMYYYDVYALFVGRINIAIVCM